MSLQSRLTDLVAAIGADIKAVRASVSALAKAPSYVPSNALNNWDAATSSYNFKQSTLHQFRAACAKLIQNTNDVDILAIFDSTGIGYNGVTPIAQSTFKYSSSIPYQFGKSLAAMMGVPFGGGMQCCAASATTLNDRWVVTGSFAASNGYLTASGVGTAEWTAIDNGTQVDLVYSNLQTNGIAWTIDNVAQTPLPTDGTSTMRKVTVTGLTNTLHKVKFTTAAGQTAYLYEIGVRNPGVKSLYVHNLGLGGSRANSGANTQNWSSTASTVPAGLGFTHIGGFNLLGYTPSLVICCVANNDLYNAVTPATTLTGVNNIRAYYPSVPFAYMHPPMVPGTDPTNFATFNSSVFNTMDTLDASFLDWNDLVGTTTGFTADGQAGPDGTHPIWGHAQMIGRLWAGLFVGPVWPLQPYAAYRVADGGARPNVPAGQVTFAAVNQPPDMQDGDAWEDLP